VGSNPTLRFEEMVIRIFNTLGKKKMPFKPRKGKKVNMFVCGPTVYDLSHIGHARAYIAFDIIAKYLRYRGYDVFYLVNITDVDDKLIARASKLGKEPLKLSDEMTKEYYCDMKSIGVDSVTKYAKASDHIKDILRQVKVLHEKGYVYELDDGIYFEVEKFKEYGKLSGRRGKKPEGEDAYSRIDDSIGKKDPRDFNVWKFSKPGEPVWETEIGKGRPGWHIEDTAITEHFFGTQYDIHGGGKDLVFPHHEAEITLMESYSGKKPMVNYWMHNGFITVEGRKMSKSKGNFIVLREALKKWDKNTMRFMFVSTHYSSPIDYSEASLRQAKKNLERIRTAYASLKGPATGKLGEKYVKKFKVVMDDDFNTPKAVALLLEMAKLASKENVVERSSASTSARKASQGDGSLKNAFDEIGGVLGIDFMPTKKKALSADLKKLIEEREAARKAKDWNTSDKLRDDLKKKGIIIADSPKGPVWTWA